MESISNDALVPRDTVSASDVRAELFQKLQSKGFLDVLKSQLRRHLIHELTNSGQKLRHADMGSNGSGLETMPSLTDQQHLSRKKPVSLKITNSLVAQHLEACQYDYTMSVFLPESGMTAREVLSLEEISHFVRLELRGIESGKDATPSILWKILSTIPERKVVLESGTQTDNVTSMPGAVGFIDQKMSAIDEHYEVKEGSSRKSARLQIEERLLGYQRQMDKMAAEQATREIERFRSIELQQMKAEEQQKFQLELERCRKEMEASYQQKASALQDRERGAFEKLQRDYELMGQETYRQRQVLLKQIEELRMREADLRKQHEDNSRECRLAEDRLKKTDDMLRSREMSLVQKEKELDVHVNILADRIRSEEKGKYEVKHKELHDLQLNLKEEQQSLRIQRERLLSSRERQELVEKRQHVMQLEALVSKYTLELSAAGANVRQLQDRLRQTMDYDALREANLVLKTDLDHVKQRLVEVLKDNEKLRERHDHLMKEFSCKAASLVSSPDFLTFKVEMERLKDMAVQDKIIAEARLADAQAKLQAQVEKNRALVLEYERQTESLRGMNRMLSQSRNAGSPEQQRSATTKPMNFSSLQPHADIPAVEVQLGSQWVPYPADAAQCLAAAQDPPRGKAHNRRRDDCGCTSELWDADRCAADISQSTSEENTTSDSLVEDARRRLRGLESEAERLQHALSSFTATVSPPKYAVHTSYGSICKLRGSHVGYSKVHTSPPSACLSPVQLGHPSAFSRYSRNSDGLFAESRSTASAAFGDHTRREVANDQEANIRYGSSIKPAAPQEQHSTYDAQGVATAAAADHEENVSIGHRSGPRELRSYVQEPSTSGRENSAAQSQEWRGASGEHMEQGSASKPAVSSYLRDKEEMSSRGKGGGTSPVVHLPTTAADLTSSALATSSNAVLLSVQTDVNIGGETNPALERLGHRDVGNLGSSSQQSSLHAGANMAMQLTYDEREHLRKEQGVESKQKADYLSGTKEKLQTVLQGSAIVETVSLDSEWKSVKGTPGIGLGTPAAIVTAAESSAVRTPSVKHSSEGPQLTATAASAAAALSTPSQPTQASPGQDEDTGIDSTMQKYMLMMKQQKEQQQQLKVEQQDEDDVETALSFSSATSEKVSKTEDEHDGSDNNFW